MVNVESISVIISTVALLVLFMFFAANFAMIALESKMTTSSLQAVGSGLVKILNKSDNPTSYKQARIYLVGSVLSLLSFMVLLEFGYA